MILVEDQQVDLTPSEFDLLVALMAAPGRVFSRLELLERLQGTAYEGYERTIDVHIRNLRTKWRQIPLIHYILKQFMALAIVSQRKHSHSWRCHALDYIQIDSGFSDRRRNRGSFGCGNLSTADAECLYPVYP